MRKYLLLLVVLVTSALAKDKFQKPGPVRLDDAGKKWAEKTLKKMSLEQKVGQVLMLQERAGFMNVDSDEHKYLRDMVRRYHLGGIVLSVPVDGGVLRKTLPYEAAVWTNTLQEDAEIPLIIAADFERGPSMRLNGTTVFPAAMAFGADGSKDDVEAFARITAQESRAIGVEWNFFPVADVNSNPANPIINTRSFGEDPARVGEFVAAYIKAAHENGMLTTAKHFPGHGDTDTDTHLAVARVGGDLQRLRSVELPPFQTAIANGVDAVMVAHVTVPALDPDPNHVASVSPKIITGLLKDQLGFKGIVITDAMEMNGVASLFAGANGGGQGRAAVAAFKAGNDIVLQPSDIDAAFIGLLQAVRGGEISHARLDESVLKVLRAKASVGLNRAKLVDLSAVQKLVAKPENVETAQSIADRAVTLLRDNGQVLPLKKSTRSGTGGNGLTYGNVTQPGSHVLAVIFTEELRSEVGRVFERQLRARVPDAKVIYLDPGVARPLTQEVLAAAEQAQTVVAVVAVVPSAGKVVMVNGRMTNTVGLEESTGALLHALLQRGAAKTAVVALGSPYLAQDYPAIQNYLCAFSNTSVSELSVIRALFGEIAIHGRLPVSIPNIAARGSGLDRAPAVVAAAQTAAANAAH
jgi:beta-N-acetylhexosaminidase